MSTSIRYFGFYFYFFGEVRPGALT
jgi:hypothetical protein